MFLGITVDDADVFFHILVIDGDLHALSAQYIGRTNQNRIAQLIGRLDAPLFCGKYGVPWVSDLALFQDCIEELTILCRIYVLCGGSEDGHTHLHQSLGQFDSGLSAPN